MSRLTRADWAVAALDAIAAGGVGAVAVEPLATRLGATKGSFYWHFKARDELVAAALDLWERSSTGDVIDRLEAGPGGPELRLRELFTRVFDVEGHAAADVALLSHADEPAVGEVLRRVTATRIDYVAMLLRLCGLPPRAAERRAVFAYSAFVGHLQLAHSAPGLLAASTGPLSRYADEVLALLMQNDVETSGETGR